jgi:hypothetical protein
MGQELEQKLAQKCGADGVARQNIGQKNREGFTTTAAPAAIGTKDPLASRPEGAVVFGRIVAVEKAVPIQCFILAAAWTALLLEGKSSFCSFWASATKRNRFDMGRFAAGMTKVGRDFFYGAQTAGLGPERTRKRGDGTDGTWPHSDRKRVRIYDFNLAKKRHFLRRHCDP